MVKTEPKPIYREDLAKKPATNFVLAQFQDDGLTPAIHFEQVSAVAVLLALDDLAGRLRNIIDTSGQRKFVLTFRGHDGELEEAVALNVSKIQVRAACLLIRTQMDMSLRAMLIGEQAQQEETDLLVPDRTLVNPNGQKLQ